MNYAEYRKILEQYCPNLNTYDTCHYSPCRFSRNGCIEPHIAKAFDELNRPHDKAIDKTLDNLIHSKPKPDETEKEFLVRKKVIKY